MGSGMATISKSVGANAANIEGDVKVVQALLSSHHSKIGVPQLKADGKCGPITVAAIKQFQSQVVKMVLPDGRIDPTGKTWAALVASQGGPGSVIAKPPGSRSDLSGKDWWIANQGKYPNSQSVSTLSPSFKKCVDPFLAAMTAAGLHYKIRATLRHRLRAYLMHYSWKLSKGEIKSSAIPLDPACKIVCDHGDEAASRKAAQEMVDKFEIIYPPVLNTRHMTGNAIDLTIFWAGAKSMKDAAGKVIALGLPTNEQNTTLHKVGLSYGVKKNVADKPHWSDNGH